MRETETETETERDRDREGERESERKRQREIQIERERAREREIHWFITVCMLSEHLLGVILPFFLYNMLHLGRDVDYMDEQSGAFVVTLVAASSHNFTIQFFPHQLVECSIFV